MFGDKAFGHHVGFPTPEETPEDTTCLTFNVPANAAWWAIMTGLVIALTEEENWQQFEGGMPVEDAAADAAVMVWDALDRAASSDDCLLDVGTPFWDDETDVDDEESTDTQPWYGEVTNPTAPADELTFVESVLLWGFTGLIAVATFEVAGVAPAILFHTTVEKFIIIQKRGDVAETIRFVVDNQDAKFVNTAPYAPGDLIETTITTPQTGGTHDLLIIGGSS